MEYLLRNYKASTAEICEFRKTQESKSDCILQQKKSFRELIKCLMYAVMTTRPDKCNCSLFQSVSR